MDNDIKKQRYYIYENINNLNNHNQIIDLINLENCKYTENDNGIFLNLNTIDDKIVTMIYNIVLNTINYKEKLYEIDEINNEVNNEINNEIITEKNETIKEKNIKQLT